MRRLKSVVTTVTALAAFAGVGAAAAPAQALSTCKDKGHQYICEYGVTVTRFADGTKQEFVVGTDHAVWTNWSHTDGSWNGWLSMEGWAQSQVEVDHLGGSLTHFTIAAIGKDGNYWFRMRWDNGQWTNWEVSCTVDPNGLYCP
ncbi:hypothetical protein ACL07V_34455 [Streptomyces sp. MB22_4]|uniref:hypothetical protein n=1 Tax=Streptomyces sp. MB22_4 TaxID=3383120 RepID=UPI0039A17FD5